MTIVRNRMKKIISAILALALIVTGSFTYVGMTTQAQADEIKITKAAALTTDGHWKINMDISGSWPTSGSLDEYKSSAENVAVVKDKNGAVLYEGKAGAVTFHKNDQALLLSVWGEYTSTNKPAKGDTVTIPACTLTYAEDSTKSIALKETTVLEYSGTDWKLCVDMDEMTIGSVDSATANDHWRFNLNVKGVWPTTGGLDRYLSDEAPIATIRNKKGRLLFESVPGNTEIYKNGEQMLLCIWGDYTANNKPSEGDTVTLTSCTLSYQNDATKAVKLSNETVLEYTGSAWKVQGSASEDPTPDTKKYSDVKFKSINSATNYRDGMGWLLYLDPANELPGKADSTAFDGIKATIGGVEKSLSLYKASHENTAMIVIPPEDLAKKPSKNTKVVIKKGKTASNDGSNGINITKDFTIYVNQYGMSTEGYCKKPSYKSLTFTSVNAATEYRAETGWLVYLDPSAALPGKADSTRFEGLKIKIGSKETAVTVFKASYQDTAMLVIPPDVLEQNIKNNTKITVKAGKATSNDGSDGINLTKDLTIYANRYGLSSSGYMKKPVYLDVKFGDINSASGYIPTADQWGFYMIPDITLPGTPDSTHYKGLKATVNGKETEIIIANSAHASSAFLALATDLIPKTVTKNIKIVIKAGKAQANDGGNGIRLTKDYTIYLNKWGISPKGFLSKPKLVQKNATLSLDRATLFGGDKNGLYLTTNDKFKTDETWQTRISSPAYEQVSGVYYNGRKADVSLIRYADGRAYLALRDSGIEAKDKDKITIRGVFALDGKAVSYTAVSYYFNGKIWNAKYEKAKGETYTPVKANDVYQVSGYSDKVKAWHIYLKTDKKLPGEGDQISFDHLTVEANGKKTKVTVFHAAYQDSLFFVLDRSFLSGNAPDGTKITLKAGKALANDLSTGISLTQDYTFYVYRGMLTSTQPAKTTKWQNVKATGLYITTGFREEANDWLLYVKFAAELKAKSGDLWLDLTVNVNGKDLTLNAQQNETNMLLVTIPASVLPKNAKSATMTIKKGSTAVANAGHDGIRFKEDFTCYMFNGMFSDRQFEKMEETKASITGIQTVINQRDVYVKLSSEFAGTAWYERYQMQYLYNGKTLTTEVCKADSSNNKTIYFKINEADVPTLKEGDKIEIKKGTTLECGGYRTEITNDYYMQYTDGVWATYKESKVKAPEAEKSLWEIARFDQAYIPVADANKSNSIMASNEDEYSIIASTEKMKDQTVTFDAQKMYDDETTPPFTVVLRGNPISEDEPMTLNMLYGYVLTFSAAEVEAEKEGEDSTWIGYIELWKNGVNYALLDQYRVHYMADTTDHPFFQFDKNYNYTFSVYNITDTCACIEVKINGKLALRYYDEAGSDPLDPAVNAGTFQMNVGCPSYFTDEVAELDTVIAEADECLVGDEIRVAATYPAIIEGAEYTVDKEGATVTDGIFKAEKEGTYTITATYNGKQLSPKTITVTKAKTATVAKEKKNFPVLPVAAGGVAVVILAGAAVILLKKNKRTKKDAE